MLGDWIVARHHLNGLVAEGDPAIGVLAVRWSEQRRPFRVVVEPSDRVDVSFTPFRRSITVGRPCGSLRVVT